ncbi:MAG TPA: hypothetical protein VIC30_12650 [Orrella sp.]
MSDESEEKSTHQMVIGLHRRFDHVEENVKALTDQAQLASERMIRMEGRIGLAEAKADALAERETLIHANVKDALAATNNLVKKLFDKFDQHTVDEHNERMQTMKDSKKMMLWVITTCVSVLTGIGMVLFTEVFTK